MLIARRGTFAVVRLDRLRHRGGLVLLSAIELRLRWALVSRRGRVPHRPRGCAVAGLLFDGAASKRRDR